MFALRPSERSIRITFNFLSLPIHNIPSDLHSTTGRSFLEQDHDRLEGLLKGAITDGLIDHGSFNAFRRGLLKHIGIEEKIFFVCTARSGSADDRETARRLRLQHGAIASVLSMAPSAAVIRALVAMLDIHNAIEEGSEGFYQACENCEAAEADEMLARIQSVPVVPVAVRAQTAELRQAAQRAMGRAGFPSELLDELT